MSLPPATTTRSDITVSRLRKEILDGEISPGHLLAESAVAQRLGVSRVPVREALFTLEREGLVEFSGTGRAYVKDLTPHDFEELYVLRLALEPVAARLAAPALREDCSRLEKNIKATSKATTLLQVTHLAMHDCSSSGIPCAVNWNFGWGGCIAQSNSRRAARVQRP
jgi:DNA-binding GntR family transcriptional regulator